MKKIFLVLISLSLFLLTGCGETDHLKNFEREDILIDDLLEHDAPRVDDYELVWCDEFDYEGKPDASKWGYDIGDLGVNNELQYYSDSEENAYVKDGYLTMTAKAQQMGSNNYTSARMVTKGKADFTYGRFEISAKLPEQYGTWPAIWMLPDSSAGWPTCGEIDIMEHIYSHGTNTSYAIHTEQNNHTNNTSIGGKIAVPTYATDFNVYALEWTAEKLTFFVNDKVAGTILKSVVTAGLSEDEYYKAWPFDKDFHIILNIALGGWGGDPLSTFVEDQMIVDYVRVYQQNKVENDNEAPTQSSISSFIRTNDEITLDFTQSTDNNNVKQYDILLDGKQIGATNNLNYTIKNLDPYESYKINVLAVDWNGNYSISETLEVPKREKNTSDDIEMQNLYSYNNIIYKDVNDVVEITMLGNSSLKYEIFADSNKEYTVSIQIKGLSVSSQLGLNVNGTVVSSGETITSTFGKYQEFTFTQKITLKEGSNIIEFVGITEVGNLYTIKEITLK